ncbi:hypothetical protein DR046_03815 [Jannaschia formosa]|nr:hypothetical protein DR046_03815 [Jannaschia formosa]
MGDEILVLLVLVQIVVAVPAAELRQVRPGNALPVPVPLGIDRLPELVVERLGLRDVDLKDLRRELGAAPKLVLRRHSWLAASGQARLAALFSCGLTVAALAEEVATT